MTSEQIATAIMDANRPAEAAGFTLVKTNTKPGKRLTCHAEWFHETGARLWMHSQKQAGRWRFIIGEQHPSWDIPTYYTPEEWASR